MNQLMDASVLFEQAYPSLVSLVATRIRLEGRSHPEFRLEAAGTEVLEYATWFGRLLRIVYRHGLTVALREELLWYAGVFTTHGWGPNGLSLLLTSWIVGIQGLIKPPECNLLAGPLQELADELPRLVEHAARSAFAAAEGIDREFFQALLEGDADQAWQRLLTTHPGAPSDRLVAEVILPTLFAIGTRWEHHRLEIFAEHLASQALQRILVRLSIGLEGTGAPRPARGRPDSGPGMEGVAQRPPPPDPRRALIACPPGDSHDLVPLALSVFLEARGWQVRNLGGGLPAGQIAAAVRAVRPHAVFLTLPMLLLLDDLLAVLGTLHRDHPGLPLVVGGRGARSARDVLERAGARVATDFAHGHRLAEAGVDAPPPADA